MLTSYFSAEIYLPGGVEQGEVWYDFFTDAQYHSSTNGKPTLVRSYRSTEGQPPIFVYARGGKILAYQDTYSPKSALMARNSTNFNLTIYMNPSGQAIGWLYFDDGETFNHHRKQEYQIVHFNFTSDGVLRIRQLINSSYEGREWDKVTSLRLVGAKAVDYEPTVEVKEIN